MERVVIVGGVAGGASAAARLRRLNEEIEIIMLDRGAYVSWANCGLPSYIGDVIRESTKLLLVTPARFRFRFNIDARVNHEVLSINRENKTVLVKNLKKGEEYSLAYNYLVLAPGGAPIKPPFPGIEDVPVFLLRTLPDAEEIKEFVDENAPQHAVIIGGGFIGLEMAENLRKRGVDVAIIEMLDQVMLPLDREMAQFIHKELIMNDISLILGDPVDSFERTNENKPSVKTKSGRIIETDLIILCIGIKPETKLAKEANLELGPEGHIIVDKHMQTSDPSIYAAGDAVQVLNLQTKQSTAIPLAGPANKQGRIAADNICGRNTEFKGILGACVIKLFDMTVAFVGLSEKDLKKTGIQFEKIYLHPLNHATYYPDARPMAFKLLFEKPSGRILGAQIVGGPGSEKRIDVIAALMKMDATVFDLEEVELTYAPPFSSAKDPVNMAGFIASNVLRGDCAVWHWHDLDKIRQKNGFLLDVRTPMEYKMGTLEGAVNINDLKFRDHLSEIPKDRAIYTFCQTGYRSYLTTRILLQHGYKEVYNLSGGMVIYKTAIATIEEFLKNFG